LENKQQKTNFDNKKISDLEHGVATEYNAMSEELLSIISNEIHKAPSFDPNFTVYTLKNTVDGLKDITSNTSVAAEKEKVLSTKTLSHLEQVVDTSWKKKMEKAQSEYETAASKFDGVLKKTRKRKRN